MSDSNTANDDNPGGETLFIIQLIFLVLAWIICLLRAYVKLFMIKKVTAEDWFMLASLLTYTASGAIVMYGCKEGGVGKHYWQLTLPETVIGMKSWYLGEVLYAPIALFARTSISLFLLRLSGNVWHKVVSWSIIAVSWVVTIAYFFLMVFQCSAPSYFWNRFIGAEGSCLPDEIIPMATIVMCGICGLLDWVIGLLPIALLWNVRINRRTKLGIASLLGMGLIAGSALFVRIPFLVPLLTVSTDFLANTVTIAILTALEPGLGILAGSIATLRPLFKSVGLGISSTKKTSTFPTNNTSRGWSSSKVSKGAIKLQEMSPTSPDQANESYFADSDMARHQYVQQQEVPRPATNHSVKVSQTSTWDVEMGRDQAGWESNKMGNSSTVTTVDPSWSSQGSQDWDSRSQPGREGPRFYHAS